MFEMKIFKFILHLSLYSHCLLSNRKKFYVTSDISYLEIELDGHKLKQKNDLNILGVRFRSNLRQEAHIEYSNSCFLNSITSFTTLGIL